MKKRKRKNDLVYSEGCHIPLFRAVHHEGASYVEFYNNKTKETESVDVSTLIVYLIDELACCYFQDKMVKSPDQTASIGIMGHDKEGGYFIEVKYKDRLEVIPLKKYVELLLKPE